MFNFCPNCGAQVKNSTFNGFKCESCHKSFYYNSKPAVGVVPYYDGKILIAVRAEEPFKGYFDSIGGFLQNGEDPLDGAVREFEEETGKIIEKSDLKLLGTIMCEYSFEGTVHQLINLIYVIPFKEEEELVPNDDVAELLWIPIDKELDKEKMTPFMKDCMKLLRSSSLV